MSKHVSHKSVEYCVFPVFLGPKGAELLQKLTQIHDTQTWYVVQ